MGEVMNIFNILIPKVTLTYLNANDTLDKAVDFLMVSGFTAVPVIDDEGRFVGIAGEGDFLRIVMENGREALSSFTVKDIVRVNEDDYVLNCADNDEIMEKILDRNFISVIDDRRIFCGIITRRSVMLNMNEE